MSSLALIDQQRPELFQNFICGFSRQFADELGLSNTPVEVFHLVGKNDSGELRSRRNRYLERISFDLARHWTHDRQSNLAVVSRRGKNERRATPGLLVSRLRIEGYPNCIAAGGNVPSGHHQISRPTGEPKSTSPCKFFLLTFAKSCTRDNFFRCTGVATTLPSETAKFNTVPSVTSASLAKGFGILRARLFPHF